LRRASSFWFDNTIQKPTREELDEAHHHAAHELALQDEGGHQQLGDGETSNSSAVPDGARGAGSSTSSTSSDNELKR